MFDTVACASYRRLDASIGASERHDLAVRVSIIRPARYCSPDAAASTASRSAFVTCARPSVGRDGEGYRSDLGPLASEISEFQKFVARPSRRLPLQLDGILGNRLICPGRAKSVHPVLRAKTIFLLCSCRLPSRSRVVIGRERRGNNGPPCTRCLFGFALHVSIEPSGLDPRLE